MPLNVERHAPVAPGCGTSWQLPAPIPKLPMKLSTISGLVMGAMPMVLLPVSVWNRQVIQQGLLWFLAETAPQPVQQLWFLACTAAIMFLFTQVAFTTRFVSDRLQNLPWPTLWVEYQVPFSRLASAPTQVKGLLEVTSK